VNLFGNLAFLLTLLVIPAALITALVMLVRRRWRLALLAGSFLLGWLGLYAAALLGVSLLSRPAALEPGQEHCFGEMCFSVLNASRSASGSSTVYRMEVQLRSAARGKTQTPDHPEMWVVDAQGKEYRAFRSSFS